MLHKGRTKPSTPRNEGKVVSAQIMEEAAYYEFESFVVIWKHLVVQYRLGKDYPRVPGDRSDDVQLNRTKAYTDAKQEPMSSAP